MTTHPTARGLALLALSTAPLAAQVPLATRVVELGGPDAADLPIAQAFTPSGEALLVVHRDTDVLAFLDVATRTVTGVVPVGAGPLDVALTPDGAFALVANGVGRSVTVVDLATRDVVRTIPVTVPVPRRVWIADDGARAVVAGMALYDPWEVSALDLAGGSEVGHFVTNAIGLPRYGAVSDGRSTVTTFAGIALTRDGGRLVVIDVDRARVLAYDVGTGQRAFATPLPRPTNRTAELVLDRAGTFAVLPYTDYDAPPHPPGVLVLDLASGTFTHDHPYLGASSLSPLRLSPDERSAILPTGAGVAFLRLSDGAVHEVGQTASLVEVTGDRRRIVAWTHGAEPFVQVLDAGAQTLLATFDAPPVQFIAAAPRGSRVAGLDDLDGEDVALVDAAGARVHGRVPSGPAPERDAPTDLALLDGGARVLTANTLSRSLSIVDLAARAVVADVAVGDQPVRVAVTGDGMTAVASNARGRSVSIVDVAAARELARVPVEGRPSVIAIASDTVGTWAYVRTVGAPWGAVRVRLLGAASAVTGTFAGGTFQDTGLALTPDGTTLLYVDAFQDVVFVHDANTHAELAQVPVHPLAMTALLHPDGSKLYVLATNAGIVQELAVDGAATAVTREVGGLPGVRLGAFDAGGALLYLATGYAGTAALDVLDLASLAVLAHVPLPDLPDALALEGDDLLATLRSGELVGLRAAGAATAITSRTRLSGRPSALAIVPGAGLAVLAQAAEVDALELARLR